MTLLSAKKAKPMEGGPSYSLRHRAFRAAWGVVWFIGASWTPPPLHRWRGWLLRCFGARIDHTARVYGSARVWYPPNLSMGEHAVLGPGVNCYCMDRISIGKKTVVSQGAYLCCGSHDIADPDFQLIIKPIVLSDCAWIAADAFIGPGVVVGEGAVIGARTVMFKDAIPFGVYVGNPGALIKKRVVVDVEAVE
jgi:putative colanic acid biosynthesis acetyltransferase WcaF